MQTRTRSFLTISAIAAVALVVTGCGDPGQSGTDDPGVTAEGEGCPPVPGEQLVVLADDQQLQTADNLVPAIHADSAAPELVAALDVVSDALDTDRLIELNHAVDVQRQTSAQAARDFADEVDLTADVAPGPGGDVEIGTADFSESQTLGELYRIALTAAGYDAEVRTVGNRELYGPALERGEIQVVPEYVGTVTEFLNARVHGAAPEPLASSDVLATMVELRALGDEVGLVFGEPSEAANQNAFAVTAAFAEEYDVATLTDLAERCSGVETLVGAGAECPERPFCLPGLTEVYGLEVGPFSSLDAGGPLTKQALRTGEISVGLVFSADGDLASG